MLQAIAKLLRCSPKIGFPSKNAPLKTNEKLTLNRFLTALSLSLLLLVTLNVTTKSITTLIRGEGEGGKCVLTLRMSEMTVNIASVSSPFAVSCSFPLSFS